MTRRRLTKAERRASILDAAGTHFCAHVYPEASIPAIAAAAGASQALVFHHFSTKAALFAALIDDRLAHQNTARTTALTTLDPGQPVHYRIDVLLDAHLRAITADPLLLPGVGEPAEAYAVRSAADHRLAQQLAHEIGVAGFADNEPPSHFSRHWWAITGIVGFLQRGARQWRAEGCNDNERRPLVEATLGALQGGLGDWRV